MQNEGVSTAIKKRDRKINWGTKIEIANSAIYKLILNNRIYEIQNKDLLRNKVNI